MQALKRNHSGLEKRILLSSLAGTEEERRTSKAVTDD